MSVDGSNGSFGSFDSRGSFDNLGGVDSQSDGLSQGGGSGSTGSFGSRSVRAVDPDSRFSMPKAASGAKSADVSKAPRTAISERSIARISDSEKAPSLKKALAFLASRAKEKALDKAAHLKDMVLSAPSSFKQLASRAAKKAKNQDWRPVKEEKLHKLEDTALEGKLRKRNHLITERSRIKAETRLQKSQVKQFQKKYSKSLALMEPGAKPPESGKFKMPGGFVVDFGKAESASEKQRSLEKLQSSFSEYSKYQEFEQAAVSIEDNAKQLAEMKQELKTLSAELEGDVEEYVPGQKEQIQTRVFAQRKVSQQRLDRTRTLKRKEHFEQRESMHAEINGMKRTIGELRARRKSISSVEVPRQEHALKELNRQRKQQLDVFKKAASSPEELKAMMEVARRNYQSSREEILSTISTLKQQRRKIPGDIEKLQVMIKKTEAELKVQSKGKQLKKDLKDVEQLAQQTEKQETKTLKREQKDAARRGESLRKSIKGR